jgi:ATP-binding cassette subfamily B protein
MRTAPVLVLDEPTSALDAQAEGRLAEQGTHAELMGLAGHYAELFTLQASAYLD